MKFWLFEGRAETQGDIWKIKGTLIGYCWKVFLDLMSCLCSGKPQCWGEITIFKIYKKNSSCTTIYLLDLFGFGLTYWLFYNTQFQESEMRPTGWATSYLNTGYFPRHLIYFLWCPNIKAFGFWPMPAWRSLTGSIEYDILSGSFTQPISWYTPSRLMMLFWLMMDKKTQ